MAALLGLSSWWGANTDIGTICSTMRLHGCRNRRALIASRPTSLLPLVRSNGTTLDFARGVDGDHAQAPHPGRWRELEIDLATGTSPAGAEHGRCGWLLIPYEQAWAKRKVLRLGPRCPSRRSCRFLAEQRKHLLTKLSLDWLDLLSAPGLPAFVRDLFTIIIECQITILERGRSGGRHHRGTGSEMSARRA